MFVLLKHLVSRLMWLVGLYCQEAAADVVTLV